MRNLSKIKYPNLAEVAAYHDYGYGISTNNFDITINKNNQIKVSKMIGYYLVLSDAIIEFDNFNNNHSDCIMEHNGFDNYGSPSSCLVISGYRNMTEEEAKEYKEALVEKQNEQDNQKQRLIDQAKEVLRKAGVDKL
jgi:hypothetical protein